MDENQKEYFRVRNKFLTDNYKIVQWMFNKFATDKLPWYIDRDDLLSSMHEVYVTCYDRYDPLKGKFSTFVYRSLYGAVLNVLNLHKRKKAIPYDKVISLDETIDGDDGVQMTIGETIADDKYNHIDDIDNLDLLEHILNQVHDNHDQVFIQSYLDDASHKEVSKKFGLEISYVYRKNRTIQRKLERIAKRTME